MPANYCKILDKRYQSLNNIGFVPFHVVDLDFPFWIRYAHFINLIFVTLLIRAGIEILSALPKFYWHDNARPGTEWIKFTKKQFPPDLKERVWISLEEEEKKILSLEFL